MTASAVIFFLTSTSRFLTVYDRDPATGELNWRTEFNLPARDIVASPDGRHLYVLRIGNPPWTSPGVVVLAVTAPGDPDPALVGHWPLDEGSGLLAANSADNGLDGVLEGSTGWTVGQQASALSFDGDDLVRVADPGAGSQVDVTDALTVAAWVRPDRLDGSTQVLVSKDDAYELEVGKLGATTWDLRLDNRVAATAPTALEEGVWQHVAATWDGSTVTFYYNGLLDGSSEFSGLLVPNNDDLGLGARPAMPFEGGPVFHFDGALDELYLYDRVLSATEIADLVLDSMTDLVPPERSALAPNSSLPAGTTEATLSLTTNEAATCRYSTTPGIRFVDMVEGFTTTGGTEHSTTATLSGGPSSAYHVRCADTLGNANGDDAVIAFGVGASDLAAGRVATWTIEAGSGCTLTDATGGFDGTLGPDCSANAPTWTLGHDGGSALQFDGADDRVTVTNTTVSGQSGGTYAVGLDSASRKPLVSLDRRRPRHRDRWLRPLPGARLTAVDAGEYPDAGGTDPGGGRHLAPRGGHLRR